MDGFVGGFTLLALSGDCSLFVADQLAQSVLQLLPTMDQVLVLLQRKKCGFDLVVQAQDGGVLVYWVDAAG